MLLLLHYYYYKANYFQYLSALSVKIKFHNLAVPPRLNLYITTTSDITNSFILYELSSVFGTGYENASGGTTNITARDSSIHFITQVRRPAVVIFAKDDI